MSDIPEPLQRILDRPLVPDPDEPTALANSGLAADIAADEKLITIEPCCWVCDESALLPRLISTGAVELWCDYPTTQRIISDGINDMPGFTTCCGHFQLKKELAG